MDINILGKEEVSLDSLHVQWVPIVTPVDVWYYNMELKSSPHVELMKILLDYGFDWEWIERTRYVKERRRRKDIGFKRWTDDYIKKHIRRRYEILKSMKKGYNPKKSEDKPIIVLDAPLFRSRFGHAPEWLKGREIWDGAGRCSAAMALGMDKIEVTMAEDAKPNTLEWGKFKKKLACVGGIWDMKNWAV